LAWQKKEGKIMTTSVEIIVHTGNEHYVVELQSFEDSMSRADFLIDVAVIRVRKALHG
jgi:hypothetical protein